MDLLAIVDTLSHFASDAKDKVEEANAEQLMATGVNTFPLLDAAVSPPKMFVSSALVYIVNQGSDLLAAITCKNVTSCTTCHKDFPAASTNHSPTLIKCTLQC
ncbi:hypothetical protein CAEBREN_20092 [Caenorhabditis brenneri]|uniref:Uncharacterized protein n=1 Tax=Caenorhabditis brenneri TaxID=135651 RepID=G0ND83_CAEBE|nr:hypothetical protein CAEBREN_20092 [Caenorhabditis brenneri]